MPMLLTFAYLIGAQMKSDRETAGLVGPVRSLYLETAEFINKRGKWVESHRKPMMTITFDLQGKIIGESVHRFMYSESVSENYRFSYDDEGRVSEQCRYHNGIIQNRVIPSYDNQGRVTESLVCDPDGTPKYKDTHKYDANGNPVELGYYKADGSLVYKNVYDNEYDSIGNLIKVITSRWTTRDDKLFSEPVLVTYRTITYY